MPTLSDIMQSKETKFLRALANESFNGYDRWVALIWFSTPTGGITAKRISDEMEAAGYGKENISRRAGEVSRDRRIIKGAHGSYSVKVTALVALDKVFGKYLEIPTLNPVAEIKNNIVEVVVDVSDVKTLPAIFIGSSSEGLKPARALEKQLERHAEVTIWKDGVFGLGGGTLETLVSELEKYDFAALLLTPDDLTTSRHETQASARDNVIFELGLFMGRLGSKRTFIVYNRDELRKLPSDLGGVTAATFKNRSDGNYHAQLSPPSTEILDAIEKLGKIARPKI